MFRSEGWEVVLGEVRGEVWLVTQARGLEPEPRHTDPIVDPIVLAPVRYPLSF